LLSTNYDRVATNLENLEYSGSSPNMENSGNSQGILCNLRNCDKVFLVRHSNICVKQLLTRYIAGVDDGHYYIYFLLWSLLFVAIIYEKVSLWLWKSLENSGNFFFYFVATLYDTTAHEKLSVALRHTNSSLDWIIWTMLLTAMLFPEFVRPSSSETHGWHGRPDWMWHHRSLSVVTMTFIYGSILYSHIFWQRFAHLRPQLYSVIKSPWIWVKMWIRCHSRNSAV